MGNIAYNTNEPEAASRPTEAARLLGALANPLRLRILRKLLQDTACVTDFVDTLGVDQPKVSQHLAVLREAGLIRCRAEGRKRCYSALWPEGLRELLGCVEALLAARDGGADSHDLNCNEP